MEPVFFFNCELHKIRISEMIPIRFWSTGYCFLWLSATVNSGNLVSFFAQNIFFSEHTRWFFLEQNFVNSEPRWWHIFWALLLYLSPLSFFWQLPFDEIPKQWRSSYFLYSRTKFVSRSRNLMLPVYRSKYAANQASSFQRFWSSKKSFSRLSISCIFIKCELPVKYLIQ